MLDFLNSVWNGIVGFFSKAAEIFLEVAAVILQVVWYALFFGLILIAIKAAAPIAIPIILVLGIMEFVTYVYVLS